MDFDAEQGTLACAYCGHTSIVPITQQEIQEYDLETAIRDYEYLESLRGRRSSAQSKRARSMVEDNDPREFFASSWFEEICHLTSRWGLQTPASPMAACCWRRIWFTNSGKRPPCSNVAGSPARTVTGT